MIGNRTTMAIAALALVATGWCFDARAAEDDADEVAKKIAELEARIEELERERAEGEQGPGGIVISKNEALTVQIGGRIHRMLQSVDDGLATTWLFTDAEIGPTTLRTTVDGRPSDELSLGAVLEVAIQQNRPLKVSQDAEEAGVDVTGRIVEMYLERDGIGKFSFGRGFSAGWLAPEIDLSGTQFAALLPVGMVSPGLKFANSSTRELTNIRVGTHFIDVERLLINDRLRYDSPRFGGVQLSGTVANDSRWDIAVRTRHNAGSMTIVGGASFQHEPFAGAHQRIDGGLSVRHEPSGLSLTAGATSEERERGATATTWVAKLGWQTDIFPLGKTAFSVDYYRASDVRLASDRAESWGVIALQKWPKYGLDFYVSVRRYVVDRPDVGLEPLLVIPFGVTIGF